MGRREPLSFLGFRFGPSLGDHQLGVLSDLQEAGMAEHPVELGKLVRGNLKELD